MDLSDVCHPFVLLFLSEKEESDGSETTTSPHGEL